MQYASGLVDQNVSNMSLEISAISFHHALPLQVNNLSVYSNWGTEQGQWTGESRTSVDFAKTHGVYLRTGEITLNVDQMELSLKSRAA